ncbi:transcriptional attenuator, LytR family [Crinalium epipsammum PCC 9333]|uniref:Transcriptional attenuator, LytR family n=2 Tax=Crinalium TaxID=241421 RepID=K9W190_9CYAN|nr:transcriptional attenuator, LytR family [Crinalium epipsammum PCC 9333]
MGSEIKKYNFSLYKKPLIKKQYILNKLEKLKCVVFFSGLASFSSALGMMSALLLAAAPLQKNQSSSLYGGSNSPITFQEPINVLVLGIDNSGHPHASNFTPSEAISGNSDTILLLRIIPGTHQINVLSIPRDTRVELPGKSTNKINDANAKGGIDLAQKSVSKLLSNIPIHRYVRVDTQGFISFADALGGVEINIPKPMRYVDQTQKLDINFSAGIQKLNGKHLQEYVRFRHDDLGDIGRVQRQEVVLKSLLEKFVQPTTWAKLPKLLKVIQENVDTDISLGEMLGVAQFLTHIDKQHINVLMLPGRFSRPDEYTLSYWIADMDNTASILADYFDTRSSKVDAIANSPTNLSNIKLTVANATGKKEQAKQALMLLRNQGFENTTIKKSGIDSAARPSLKTLIIAQKGNLKAANAVKNAIGIGEIQVTSTGDIDSDVTVVLGSDFADLKNNNGKKLPRV